MTSHELAKKLLEGPDLPVELKVGGPKDTYIGDVGDADVSIGEIDVESMKARGYPDTQPGQCVHIGGWMSSEQYDEDDE